MKIFFCIAALLFTVSTSVGTAGEMDDVNVLSYYAVGNSLDGQPLIDRMNVLRFFPVFAMRSHVQYAKVTIYYGGNIYSRYATRMNEGEYWEILLPQFRLGEAIQRIEVETNIQLVETPLLRAYRNLQSITTRERVEFIQGMKTMLHKISTDSDSLQDQVEGIREALPRTLQATIASVQNSWDAVRQIRSQATADTFLLHALYTTLQSADARAIFSERLQPVIASIRQCDSSSTPCTSAIITLLEDLIRNVDMESLFLQRITTSAIAQAQQSIQTIQQSLERLGQSTSQTIQALIDVQQEIASVKANTTAIAQFDSTFSRLIDLRDSLHNRILTAIEENLTDTNYSGPSIKRSDIILNDSLTEATILYRNYKTALRYMPALDPAEKIGVFRARYVPLAVTGSKLHRPMSEHSQAIFEVGLAFGDAIVTGDDFVLEEFSGRRLGIAFAITDRLFSDDAEVLALALTYDFNSYGSIAFGANFRKNAESRTIVERYTSFGINKRAFEALLGQLQKLFL